MIYRIYTEDVKGSEKLVLGAIGKRFDCATLYKGIGVWKGSTEASLIIEIITDTPASGLFIHALAKELKTLLKQEAALVVGIEEKVNYLVT